MNVLVIGGAGYAGSVLVPKILDANHNVTVLDTFWYGEDSLRSQKYRRLSLIKGDIRSALTVREALMHQDMVIHLACISNDPSFELDSKLGKSVNYDSFPIMLDELKRSKVKRFIYASSSSVYGLKDQPNVTEDTLCEPLTDYSKFKLLCERDLQNADLKMDWTIVRPATLCGYSPRLRLDLVVNILTMSALINKKINVFGGTQLRPNLNVKDMAQAYVEILHAKSEKVNKEIFNVGYENMSLNNIAKLVKDTLKDSSIKIETHPTTDNRSYHVNSDKITAKLGFRPRHTISQAISSLVVAGANNLLVNPLENPIYFNIKQMHRLGVK